MLAGSFWQFVDGNNGRHLQTTSFYPWYVPILLFRRWISDDFATLHFPHPTCSDWGGGFRRRGLDTFGSVSLRGTWVLWPWALCCCPKGWNSNCIPGALSRPVLHGRNNNSLQQGKLRKLRIHNLLRPYTAVLKPVNTLFEPLPFRVVKKTTQITQVLWCPRPLKWSRALQWPQSMKIVWRKHWRPWSHLRKRTGTVWGPDGAEAVAFVAQWGHGITWNI